jgi:indole-3-glycerol phosphate synthase
MDHLDRIMQDVLRSIEDGYYRAAPLGPVGKPPYFCDAIAQSSFLKNAIIAELKPASLSEGALLGSRTIDEVLALYVTSGVTGLSVLTEPNHFRGSLEYLRRASLLGLPVLMKDFVIRVEQLDAASAHGASAVLLIVSLFERGYAPVSLDAMIAEAHARNLEVLLEVASLREYHLARKTRVQMIGINNRDLATLRVDLNRTVQMLAAAPKDRLVWSLSGIQTNSEVRRLRNAGSDAFLVGTSLLKDRDPCAMLKQLLTL